MRHALRIAVAVVLPLVIAAQGFAWYGGRSVLYTLLVRDLYAEWDDAAFVMTVSTVALVAGTGVATLLAAGLGPLPTAAIGLAVAAAGTMLTAGADSTAAVMTTYGAAAFGMGLFRPALWAGAVRWFGRGWESARTALCVLLYAGLNVGAFFAPLAGAQLAEVPRAVLAAGGLPLIAASVTVLALFAASWFLPRDEGPGTAEAIDGRALAVGFGAAVLGAIGLGAWSVGLDLQSRALYAANPDVPSWVYTANPVVVVVTGLLLALVLAIAQAVGFRVPALAIGGLGLIVLAAGFGPGLGSAGTGAFVGGSVIGAIGEVMAFPALASRAAGAVHFRLSTLAIAILAASSHGAWLITQGVGDRIEAAGLAQPAVAACAGVCALVGLVLLVAAIPVERVFLADEPDAPPS